MSWKIVTTADAEYPQQVFNTPEIVAWNETTGSAKTVTIEVITDNVTLNDDECWVDWARSFVCQMVLDIASDRGRFRLEHHIKRLAAAISQTS
jgi:hypothetical protein